MPTFPNCERCRISSKSGLLTQQIEHTENVTPLKTDKTGSIRQGLVTNSNIRVKTWNPIWPKMLIVDSNANFFQMLERFQASKSDICAFFAPQILSFRLYVFRKCGERVFENPGRKSYFSRRGNNGRFTARKCKNKQFNQDLNHWVAMS